MPKRHNKSRKQKTLTFIDLFSGCGGLSLGLINSGWRGLFAIEKNKMAFKTLRHNLVDGDVKGFNWPTWLEKEAMPVSRLTREYRTKLASLRGKVDLISGGPPCQGFSLAGRRNKDDPRNKLTSQYLEVVSLVKPRFLLIENVRGFNIPFSETKKIAVGRKKKKQSYAQVVAKKLAKLGYNVFSQTIRSVDYGVPQRRPRFLMIAIKKGELTSVGLTKRAPFDVLTKLRGSFLKSKQLDPKKPVSVSEAISDLRVKGKRLISSIDSPVKGFMQIDYKPSKKLGAYRALLRKGMNGTAPTDLRLPRHNPETIKFFSDVISTCKLGQTLSELDRKQFGIKKQALTPLHPNKPAATVTTLPDDILHYSEARILTVRENARLQSFPDWFSFQGKYTTGGKARKHDCPRYTQVGNAVPPLLGEAVGLALQKLASKRLKRKPVRNQ